MKCCIRKQIKLRTVLLAPIKFVCKASQFYSKCLDECNGKMNYGVVIFPVPLSISTPRNFCPNSRYSKGINYDEETKQLSRSAAIRRTFIEEVSKREMEKQIEVTKLSIELQSDLQKSYNVRVGKLGRIDENEPCSFMEKDHLLYSKSQNSAARKNYLY